MAIKGKKKSQTRGSQGQRRPAAAPRPVYTGRKHVPWYKTTEGRLIGGMVIAVIVGVSIWLIADAQNRAEQRTATRESLEEYATSVRAFATTIAPVAEEMGAVPADPEAETLEKDSGKWSTDLTAAQGQVTVLTPPDEAALANKLFLESLNSFLAAARTYESAATADGDLRGQLLTQATQQREQAATLFTLAVEALDNELIDVGGDSSGLSIPQGNPPPQPGVQTGTDTTVIPAPDGDGGGGGGKRGGGKKGGGDQGDGN